MIMQNFFLYGNPSGPPDHGNNVGANHGLGRGNEQQELLQLQQQLLQQQQQQQHTSAQMVLDNFSSSTSTAQALQVAGYPSLMQQYLQQQQQRQHQASTASSSSHLDPLFSAAGLGLMALPNQSLSTTGMPSSSVSDPTGMLSSLSSLANSNSAAQTLLARIAARQNTHRLMDANRLLLQRLQQGDPSVPSLTASSLTTSPSFRTLNTSVGGGRETSPVSNAVSSSAIGPTSAEGAWAGNMTGQGDPYAESGILGPWSATSAGLLGKMATISSHETKAKRIRKKPKDKPKRPLSAYNIFFKEERARILGQQGPAPEGGAIATATTTGETDEAPSSNVAAAAVEANSQSQEQASASGTSPEKKTRKRKKQPHGKIGFENLAKVIGQRWQELAPDQVEYYKKQAEADMKRYKEQMEEYLIKRKEEDGKRLDDDEENDEDDDEDVDSSLAASKSPKRSKMGGTAD